MFKRLDAKFLEALVADGLLNQAQADACVIKVNQGEQDLIDIILSMTQVSEEDLLRVLSTLHHIETIDLRDIEVSAEAVKKVPVRFAIYYKVMPVRIEGRALILARAAPLDLKVRDEIRVHLGLEPRIVLAKRSDIQIAYKRYYGLAADTVDALDKQTSQEDLPSAKNTDVEDIDAKTEDPSVTRLVNQILLDAYHNRATDIHIEPYRKSIRVRYRVDGALVDANVPPEVHRFLPSIVSRIKIMANLSIVEKRIPQDGSAVVKTKEQNLDLRVSTIPTLWGESLVIRILPTHMTVLDLGKLGLEKENLTLFRELIKQPHGIILVTGPTGSGKTTTLYACLHEINTPKRKIITLEDPVEYEMEGITQIQVNPKVSLDFAAGLRSILRHDPDVIMVGEVRDLETAEIAIRTALTGHLVFSTLHTNDAASGVTRLVEMGLEPFLVSSSVEAFVAQRLVRTICPKCKEEVKTPQIEFRQEIADALKLSSEDVKIYRGRGCDHCNRTGFHGRTAIYEVLKIYDDVRKAILERRNAEDIKRIALHNGMISLRQDGWRKVIVGLTTPEEVINVTVADKCDSENSENIDEASGMDKEKKNIVATESVLGPVKKKKIAQALIDEKKDLNDKRVYPRAVSKVNLRFLIYHQQPNDPTQLTTNQIQHASVTKDISAGGLRFVSGYALPVGTLLDLSVELGKAYGTIRCMAKVCRVEDDAFSAMFYISVFFLDLPSAERVLLERFVKANQSDQTVD